LIFRIPRVLQEQNSVPGLVNWRLARHADLVLWDTKGRALGCPRGRERWWSATVAPHAGPSRTAAEFLRLDAARPTVLVVGGSRGAHSLNLAGADAAARLAAERGIQFVILSGGADRAEVERRVSGVAARVRVLEYLDEMHFAYGLADVAVARAGASSVFELALFGVPAVFVPYPFAADAHQEHNAEPLVRAGGALIVRDAELTGERLAAAIDSLLAAPERRRAMAEAMRAWSTPDAADRAADAILEVAKKKECAVTTERLAA
jgi:UDP-N-acetylglucosamine--N-acetylmuramyl-(pentapeptide) pyrophosphoryl-undecaprenol N-acetylglucosamine transferase